MLTFALALGLTLGLPAYDLAPERFGQRMDERHWTEGLERAVRHLATTGVAAASGFAAQTVCVPTPVDSSRAPALVPVLFARAELTDLPPPDWGLSRA